MTRLTSCTKLRSKGSLHLFALMGTAIALTAPLSAQAERWQARIGTGGEWVGNWYLHAATGNFRFVVRNGNAAITAEGFYMRSGNTVSIARSKSSDGNDCHYMGTINGNQVTGIGYCTNGGPTPWSATIAEPPAGER